MSHYRKEQENADKEIGHDKPVVLRYYGDSRREIMQKYGGVHSQRPLVHMKSAPQLKEKLSLMEIPSTEHNDNGKKLFMTTVADGSTIVQYPFPKKLSHQDKTAMTQSKHIISCSQHTKQKLRGGIEMN